MKTQRIAIVGYGQRGRIYANYALRHPDEFKVVAVADINPAGIELAKTKHDCPTFDGFDSFLKAGVDADVVAIATQDRDHFAHAIACMKKGYDLLLEKPAGVTLEECNVINDTAKKLGRKIVVCYVLRYTSFYRKIKEMIDSGELGDIVNVNTSENVGYYHQAHSFVRGPWRNSAESCPMIVAKCCHDTDVMNWLVGKKCNEVFSYGGLDVFRKERAPKGSSAYCSDCKVDCVYRASDVYKKYVWMRAYYSNNHLDEEAAAKDLVHSRYDRCVYRCDNDVVDHQICLFSFDSGVTASHSMTAFSNRIYRDIKISGTRAELFGIMENNSFEVRTFGGETKVYDLSSENVKGTHGGGDEGLMHNLYLGLNGSPESTISYFEESIDSYRMAFGAEISRLSGKPFKI